MASLKEPKDLDSSQIAKDLIGKIYDLKLQLNRDLQGCDAKWTLFVAAALSYKYEMLLQPFPAKYINEHRYDIETLTSVINNMPALKVILHEIIEENYDDLDVEVVELLHWVLTKERDPYLRTLGKDETRIILYKATRLQLNSPLINEILPNYAFEVTNSVTSNTSRFFKTEKEQFQIKYVFHGGKIDSFYSVLNNGLEKVEDEEICLRNDLKVAAKFSPIGATWGASSCGPLTSCIAICEYLDNPEWIKASENDENEKDFTMLDNTAIRVRYLLFYSNSGVENKDVSVFRKLFNWIGRNKYALPIFCYSIFLTSILIANSGGGVGIKNFICQKFSQISEVLTKFLTY